MKTSLFSLWLIGGTLAALPLQTAPADDTTSSGPSMPSGASTNSGAAASGRRLERFKQAFAQLGLTDAQKEQIKQIRASVTDRKERREQIMNVLTPDQKAKLRELIEAHRNGAPSGDGTSALPNGG
jgi:Spy/CpxP family protein refolding chaperone